VKKAFEDRAQNAALPLNGNSDKKGKILTHLILKTLMHIIFASVLTNS